MDAAAFHQISGDARLRILAEVSHALAEITTDYASVLRMIAATCARLVGDGCLVTVLDSDRQQLVGAASSHRDLDLEQVYREYVAGLGGVAASGSSVSATVVRTGDPVFVASIDPAALIARSESALRPLLERLDVHSFIVVPIRAHGSPIGTLSMLRSGPGRNYVHEDVILLQDLADRAGLAIDNARLYQELELRVAQRTSELETFSFAVAHSIRAPLRSIAAFSDALFEDANDRLEQHSKSDLERIRSAVARVRETVDSLLHLSKLAGTELRRTTFDLSALAEEEVNRLRSAHSEHFVDVAIESNIQVRADERLVRLALSTLLANAWQSTRSRSDAHVSVEADRGGRVLAIVVRDNGILKSHQAQALLARSASSKDQSAGDFGVGLIIARQVVEQHGGSIEVDSAEIGGTAVRFTLSGETGMK